MAAYTIINQVTAHLARSGREISFTHDGDQVIFYAPDGNDYIVTEAWSWNEDRQEYCNVFFDMNGRRSRLVLAEDEIAWFVSRMLNAVQGNRQFVRINDPYVNHAENNLGTPFNNERHHDVHEMYAYLYSN